MVLITCAIFIFYLSSHQIWWLKIIFAGTFTATTPSIQTHTNKKAHFYLSCVVMEGGGGHYFSEGSTVLKGGVIQLCRKIITRVTSKINSAAGFCVELRRLSTKKVTNVISGEL